MNTRFVLLLMALFLLIIVADCSAQTSPWEVGAEVGFAGGPFFSLIGSYELADQVNLDLTLGGFPGVLLRSKLDLRYSFFESRFSPYLQAGTGYIHIFRWEHPNYDHIYEFHLRGGAKYSITKSLTVKGDVGLFWASHAINPQVKREFPEVVPIVPVANIGFLFGSLF